MTGRKRLHSLIAFKFTLAILAGTAERNRAKTTGKERQERGAVPLHKNKGRGRGGNSAGGLALLVF
jgi:hypothetical protein